MADKTTTNFEKMGDSWFQAGLNASGSRSGYTTLVPKKNSKGGNAPSKTANHRGSTQIKSALGPTFKINATLYSPNAASAAAGQRNVRLMGPATRRSNGTGSAGDFWTKRQFGQALQ